MKKTKKMMSKNGAKKGVKKGKKFNPAMFSKTKKQVFGM